MVTDTRKSIKIKESVYNRLREVQGKGETISECISRLIEIVEVVQQVSGTLGPSHYLNERPKQATRDD